VSLCPPSLIIQQIDHVLVEILPVVIIAHDSLRVGGAAHHPALPVAEPLVEHPGDRRPPQVVRRDLPCSAVVSPAVDYVLHHPRREGPGELQRPVVDQRLEEKGLLPVAVKIPPPRLVEFQVVPDRRPHLIRNRQSALAAALDPKPDDPAPVAPVEIRDLERADLGDANPDAAWGTVGSPQPALVR